MGRGKRKKQLQFLWIPVEHILDDDDDDDGGGGSYTEQPFTQVHGHFPFSMYIHMFTLAVIGLT